MKVKDNIIMAAGIAGIAVIGSGLIIGLLYWLTSLAGQAGTRWWAIMATMIIPLAVIITYHLATHAAREHLAGFDRGLTGAQRTVETMGRSLAATASLAKTSPQNRARSFNDLLPQPGMKIVDDHHDDSGIVDL